MPLMQIERAGQGVSVCAEGRLEPVVQESCGAKTAPGRGVFGRWSDQGGRCVSAGRMHTLPGSVATRLPCPAPPHCAVQPRDWSVDMNKKERRLALATALQVRGAGSGSGVPERACGAQGRLEQLSVARPRLDMSDGRCAVLPAGRCIAVLGRAKRRAPAPCTSPRLFSPAARPRRRPCPAPRRAPPPTLWWWTTLRASRR